MNKKRFFLTIKIFKYYYLLQTNIRTLCTTTIELFLQTVYKFMNPSKKVCFGPHNYS